MSSDGDLFNQLIQNPFPTNQQTHGQYQGLQALSSAPSNALAQGNVLLKIACGNEIRCRSVSEDYGWEDLQYMVQQMFAGQISPRDPMTLRFRDPEGDWVTMGGEDEFNLAKQLTHKLHISVSQKGTDKGIADIPQLRSQLVRLRDDINRVLEQTPVPCPLAPPPDPPVPPPEPKETDPQPVPSVLDVREEPQPRTVSPHASAAPQERTGQYSNLGQLPTAILPNPSQPYEAFPPEKSASVRIYQPPVSVAPALPTAPSLGSASALFHAQQTPAFPVAPPTSAPYPPQAFGHPQTHPAPYNQFYTHPGLYRPN